MHFHRLFLLALSALLIQSCSQVSSLAQGISDKTVMLLDSCSPARSVPQIKDDRNGRIHAVGIYHGHIELRDEP